MIRLLRFLYTLVNGSDHASDADSGAIEGHCWLTWHSPYSDEP